jgi:M6 family metalloprotease-like protein/uncharacterized repeat protein (TIGR01451 family)
MRTLVATSVAAFGLLALIGEPAAGETAAGEPAAGWAAPAEQAAACTLKQRKQRQRAIGAYRKRMPKDRAQYFRRHSSKKKRAVFVKKQQAHLKALRRALARCSKTPVKAAPVADVALTISATGINQITYTLTVKNAGPGAASETTLTDSLPAALAFVQARTTRGSCRGGTTVVCGLGSLPSGAEATVTVVAWAHGGMSTNSAVVESATHDPRPGNNGASADFTVPPLPSASTGPPCAPSLARGPLISIGHPSTYTEGATDYNVFIRPAGAVHTLMLFVDFSDAPATETTASVYDHIAPDASAWFSNMSAGRVSLQVDGHNSWVRMPHPSTFYGLSTGGYSEQYVRDAIATADPAVDFTPYELVYLIPSAGASIDRGQSPYAFGSGGLMTAERELRHVTYVGPSYREPWVLEHETLHHFGLPDLYDFDATGGSARHVDGWDIMSKRVGALFAWHEWKLGWIDPAAIRCLAGPGQLEETLTPVTRPGGVKAVVVPTDASRAYVVEARQAVGRDAAICDSGVLVYTVDATVWSGSGPIRIKAAPNAPNTTLVNRCGPLYNAPFDVGPGEVATLRDGNLTVEVLFTSAEQYRIRVTRG